MILAPNHQSWLDPVLVQAAVYPHAVTFLMTELFYDLPVANLYFRAMGARPVRENGPSVSGMRAALDALRAGEIVCLFPEGGLSNDGRLQPGRRGVARIARRSGAPVVPVGIRGSFHVLSRAQRIPRLHPVSVRLGAEMPPPAQDGREAEARFLDELMARIGALAS